MSRAVLLDTNILIGAFEPEQGNEPHMQAQARLRALLQDPDVKLAITPLIRYEVLRGARRVSVEQLDERLNAFQEFDVRGADARRAAEIYRQAQQQGTALDKRKFDVFHWVCAELNQLEIDSADGDIQKIRNLVQVGQKNA
jgi:predicted nucleic acid-binding protein